MTPSAYAWLVLRALYELARYDVIHLVLRVRSIRRHLPPPPIAACHVSPDTAAAINDAFVLATCLYWKPARCLQRSVCLVRLLRARGVPARLVIGYRPDPFLSHAWVEVDGLVINDSPAYQRRLHVLMTA